MPLTCNNHASDLSARVLLPEEESLTNKLDDLAMKNVVAGNLQTTLFLLLVCLPKRTHHEYRVCVTPALTTLSALFSSHYGPCTESFCAMSRAERSGSADVFLHPDPSSALSSHSPRWIIYSSIEATPFSHININKLSVKARG